MPASRVSIGIGIEIMPVTVTSKAMSLPVWNQDFCRSRIRAWDESTVFSGGFQASLLSSTEQGFSEAVMYGDLLSSQPAADGMVSNGINVSRACWALTLRVKHLDSQSVPDRDHEFGWVHGD